MNVNFDPYALKSGEVSTGTTICAILYNGGVMLAADTRTTTGSVIANRVTDKLAHLFSGSNKGSDSQTTIFGLTSGSAADSQAVSDIIRYHLSSYKMHYGMPTTELAAKLTAEICYSNKDNLSTAIIIAGYDQLKGGSIYNILLGGSLHQTSYAISGSGSAFIMGFLDKNYRPNMEKEEAITLLRDAVAMAIERDGSSGGAIRMLNITKDGFERFYFNESAQEIPRYFYDQK